MDGEADPLTATVGRRLDGAGVLYPGRVHSVAAESEAGKTWFGLSIAVTELERGNGVVVLDFEDSAFGVVGRLIALKVHPTVLLDQFAYIAPTDPIGAGGNRDVLGQVLRDLRPTVVLLDGVTEAMTLHGLDLRDNVDVARFGRLLPRAIATTGPAVLLNDHVVKDPDGRGRYAIGGVHKLNGVDGAAYVLTNRQPFGIGVTGRSTVHLAKDRPGHLRQFGVRSGDGMTMFADLVVESYNETSAVAYLNAPKAAAGPWRPTILMARISARLATAGEPLSQRDILSRVEGKSDVIRQAIAALQDGGYIAIKDGKRGSKLHHFIKSFEDDDAPV